MGPPLPRGDVPHPRGADAVGRGRRGRSGRLVRIRHGVRLSAGAGVPAASGGARAGERRRRCSSDRRRSRRKTGRVPCATAPICSGRTGRSPAGRTSSSWCRSASSCRSSACSSSPGRWCRRSGTSSRGSGREVLSVPGGRFGTLVCYEVIFPDLVRRFAAAGAEFLVNITNDAWYERSAASEQQFANLVFRAVENRRPIARSANTGISGFVDTHGRIISASELFVRGQYRADAGALAPHDALHALGRLAAAALRACSDSAAARRTFSPGACSAQEACEITLYSHSRLKNIGEELCRKLLPCGLTTESTNIFGIWRNWRIGRSPLH